MSWYKPTISLVPISITIVHDYLITGLCCVLDPMHGYMLEEMPVNIIFYNLHLFLFTRNLSTALLPALPIYFIYIYIITS